MIAFILNLPYTIIGVLLALLLRPRKMEWGSKPYRIVFNVKDESLEISYLKGWRGMTVGHTIILNPREEEHDLEHEIIHVRQAARLPLIFPIFYYWEMWRHGYRNNKYEEEAYTGSGSIYRAGKSKQ